jgi:hypothetical protein
MGSNPLASLQHFYKSFFNMLKSHNWTFALVFILILSAGCARTKVLNSTKIISPISVDGNTNDWPTDRIQLNTQGEYDLYVSNDDEFLYVFIGLKNNQLYQNIQRYGLTLFFDSNKDLRRSFGILYPTGILNVLNDIPGARKEYLENPGWSNMPENKRLIESIEESMGERVMIIQRVNKRDPILPVPISTEALKAQSVELSMDRTASVMYIEMKIPLKSTRARQFAIDAGSKNDIYFGFEVIPPSLEEMMGEDYRAEDITQNARDPYGNRLQNNQQFNPAMYSQLRGEYSRWNRIRLSK